jgi:pimeloyl-ACP methyl ester carboxylesterase
MTQNPVEFAASDGTMLRGLLYLPETSAPSPGVVMTHGFSAVKEMGLPPFAEAIRDAGCAVLLYDHRGLGGSDGKPRQQINPWAQMRDMRQALTWLGDRSEVDAERLGLWGSSFSGGEVLVLGAIDDRVRAVVANVPFAGLAGADYDSGTERVVTAISEALADGSLSDGTDATVFGPMAVVNEEGNEMSAFLGQPESSEWFLAIGAGTTWRNEVTLANAFGTEPPFDPGACVAHLRCPTLFVVASDDQVAEAAVALAAYERAPEPKQLLVLDGHHFAPYAGTPQLEAASAASAWFASHL